MPHFSKLQEKRKQLDLKGICDQLQQLHFFFYAIKLEILIFFTICGMSENFPNNMKQLKEHFLRMVNPSSSAL